MNFLSTAFRIKSDNSSGDIVYLDFDFKSEGENGHGFPTMEAITKKEIYYLENYMVSAVLPSEISSGLSNDFGIDLGEVTNQTLINESIIGDQKNLYSKYLELGDKSRMSELKKSRWNRFLLRFIPETHFVNYVTPETLPKKIILNSYLIATRSRKGPSDFLVCSSKYATLLMETPGFCYPTTKEVMQVPGHIDYIGTLGDRMMIFVNRLLSMEDDKIVLGKITNENENGVYFIEGNSHTEEFTDSLNGQKTIRTISRKCIVSLEGAEKSFQTIRVSDGKKPFWKKILFIK